MGKRFGDDYDRPRRGPRRGGHLGDDTAGRRARADWGGHGGGPRHGGPWGGPRGGWGPGRRARRGAVRGLVLSVLAEGPAHGYDVMQRLETRSGGMWRPSPGSVYPLLQMLEDEGLVSSDERDGRRTYQLTEAGRAEADAQKASGSAPWEEGAGEEARALREAVGEVVQAARQVARHGRPEQISRSMEAVRGARKAIYEILAED